MNSIATIRKDIRKYFSEQSLLRDEEEVYGLSGGGLYYYTCQFYKQTDKNRNWVVSRIEIHNIETNEKLLEYLADSDDAHHSACWFQKGGNDYLFLPEVRAGQTIVDMNNRQLYSYYSPEEPFIWQSIFPSPDKNKIAVDGCYWACPNELRIYDITNQTALPYPCIYQMSNFTNEEGCVFEEWVDNTIFTICKNKNEIVEINLVL